MGKHEDTINEMVIGALLAGLYTAIAEPKMDGADVGTLSRLVDALEEQVVDLVGANAELEEKLVAAEKMAEMYRTRLTAAQTFLHALIDKV